MLVSPMNNYVLGLEFGADGELFASDVGHVVRFDRLRTEHPRARDVTARTSSAGWGMDLSSDGRVLAVSSGSDVLLFDAHTLRPISGPIPATRNRINWIAFNRNGTELVAGDAAYQARLIDVKSQTPLGPVLLVEAGSGAVFSRDGRTLGTLTPWGGALMDVDPHDWRTDACELAGRNLTKQEWTR